MARLLTVEDVAKYLCVSTKAVYQMVYMGKLRYVKMGPYRSSRIRFIPSDIEEYINKCSIQAYA